MLLTLLSNPAYALNLYGKATTHHLKPHLVVNLMCCRQVCIATKVGFLGEYQLLYYIISIK